MAVEDRVERFNEAVERFLERAGLQSISEISEANQRRDFLLEPAIAAYLTRPATDVQFDNAGEPIYDSEYESQYYDLCRKSKGLNVPFRAESSHITRRIDDAGRPVTNITPGVERATAFYDSDMSRRIEHFTYQRLGRLIDPVTIEQSGYHVFIASNAEDIFQMGGVLKHIQGEVPFFDGMEGKLLDPDDNEIILPDDGTSFIIFPTRNDKHAIITFAVLDNASRQVIRTGLCNSLKDKDSYHALKRAINMDMKFQSGQVMKPFPFLDCSHNLQTSETDQNCGFYRAGFARALVEMLQNEQDICEMLTSRGIADGKIADGVSRKMKRYLPEYYEEQAEGFVETSLDERRRVHLQARWEAGNDFLREKIKAARRTAQPGRSPSGGG
jgi:hypothetical protein